jgi:serine/threonine protein phosphatase PrpC
MQPWLLIAAGLAVLAGTFYLAWTLGARSRTSSAPAGAAGARGGALGDGTVPVEIPSTKPTFALPTAAIPFEDQEDPDVEVTQVGGVLSHFVQPTTKLIVLDAAATEDEPPNNPTYFLVSAAAQTDRGLRRKRNEDSLLVLPDLGVYIVADGMGGYAGGEIASQQAVETLYRAFQSHSFDGDQDAHLPPLASELARAIQMANVAILERAQVEPTLTGMGTTVCACRFSETAQRLYVGHVGDSRLYRVRAGQLEQLTTDHTLGEFGVAGPMAAQLSRAVGIWPMVTIDVLCDRPRPDDVYIVCSDGLTKMLTDAELFAIVHESAADPGVSVERLISTANSKGGADNITVILIRVMAPGV